MTNRTTSLTTRELLLIEDLGGVDAAQLDQIVRGRTVDRLPPRLLAVLHLITRRRELAAAGEDPGTFTWDDALDTPVTEAAAAIGVTTATPTDTDTDPGPVTDVEGGEERPTEE